MGVEAMQPIGTVIAAVKVLQTNLTVSKPRGQYPTKQTTASSTTRV
jgi:hypothetical protein